MTLTYSTKPNFESAAQDFSLPGSDGETYSLTDFAAAKALVVVFTCNHCPYAQAIRPRLIDLAEMYTDKGIQFIAINANDEHKYPEDGLTMMSEEQYDYPFPYLRDEKQGVARAYGAVCTPDIFVYDADRNLVYHGRFDDNWQEPEAVTQHNLHDAVEAILRGQGPLEEQIPSMGCSIKWLNKINVGAHI